MPLRTAAIRRCGFKLPKNDKYQCQKAGDNFQLIVNLWYCRQHDRHAQDRCQVWVQWAGKGAQCEQLGVLDKRSGKKLWEWHLWKANGDDWTENGAEQCDEISQDRFDRESRWQKAALPDDLVPNHPEPLHTPPSDGSVDTPGQTLLASVESQSPMTSMEASTGLEPSDQESQTEEHFNATRTPLSDSDCNPYQVKIEDRPALRIETSALTLHKDAFEENDIHPSLQLFDEPFRYVIDANPHIVAKPNENEGYASPLPATNVGKSTGRSHTRVDSLSPCTSKPQPEDPNVRTPNIMAYDAGPGTPSRQSVNARIAFLNALQDQEASASDRIVAVYAQCCVCLEKHGEHNMREVVPCTHRYRELCLRKAKKAGILRRFNCSSCRTWMIERHEDMVQNGNL